MKSPVVIRSVRYASIAEAARALNVSPSVISTAKMRGTLDRVGSGTRKPVSVEIRGTTYPSLNAAARALNITPQAVWNALENGKIDTVGLGRWGNK